MNREDIHDSNKLGSITKETILIDKVSDVIAPFLEDLDPAKLDTINIDKFVTKVTHVLVVRENINMYSNLLLIAGSQHDHDKLDALTHGRDSHDSRHYQIQRHHWQASKLKVMTLIDLLEMCADGCAVAAARNGHFECPLQDDEFNNDAIRHLISNTVHLLDNSIIVDFYKASEYKF